MAITLSDLRTYAREIAAADVASGKADREVNRWINKAIKRIWRAHPWTYAQVHAQIALDVEEEGAADDMTLTKGSRSISIASGTFDSKYVSERWHLIVSGEAYKTFELVSIDTTTTATMVTGHVWTQDTTTTGDYSFVRHIYPLPQDARTVERVEVVELETVMAYMGPAEFDMHRQRNPTQRSTQPLYFTLRGGNIEIWPANGTNYYTLQLTMRKQPPLYTTSDADATEVDWPEEWSDLLYAGISYEASITQGKNSPVQYHIAREEFREALSDYKAEDTGLAHLGGPMGVILPRYMPGIEISDDPTILVDE